jgi:hypothetical protein
VAAAPAKQIYERLRCGREFGKCQADVHPAPLPPQPYIDATATESADGDNTISALKKFIDTYGAPHEFASDNGSHFKNNKIFDYLAEKNIKHCFGIPIHPQSQATVERAMGTLQKLMRCTVLYGGGWAQHVPYIAYTYNTAYHRALKTSPYNMFYNSYPPSILKTAVAFPANSPKDEHERQLLAAEFSRHFEGAAEQAFKERARTHARQTRPTELQPYDYVTLWSAHERTDKLQPYVDIRRVRERVSDSVYVIEQVYCDPINGTDKNQESSIVHVDRIKKISKPHFTRQQQRKMNIAQAKDGRGVVGKIKGHIYVHGKAHLIVQWLGIEDAETNDNKINTLVEPKHLTKCKVAQEYLKTNGFVCGPNGSCTKPNQTKSKTSKERDADQADGVASSPTN